MPGRIKRNWDFAVYVTVAALACLQPGIDPVFLSLMSDAHDIAASDHGFIVGAAQTGMALGALMVWQVRAIVTRSALIGFSLCAFLIALTASTSVPFPVLIAFRCAHGFALGVVYTGAMGTCSAIRPTGSYAFMLLLQLVLAAGAAMLLPAITAWCDSPTALTSMAIVPASIALLLLFADADSAIRTEEKSSSASRDKTSPDHLLPALVRWAPPIAVLFFVSSTMMVWSYTAAMASMASIDAATLGLAVSLGSAAGALTAFAVWRIPAHGSAFRGAVPASLALVSPMMLTLPDRPGLFLISIILMNIGSTAVIIRASGLAAARAGNSASRRFVACTHPLGMICGPVAGSWLNLMLGTDGPPIGAVLTSGVACLALLITTRWTDRLPEPCRSRL